MIVSVPLTAPEKGQIYKTSLAVRRDTLITLMHKLKLKESIENTVIDNLGSPGNPTQVFVVKKQSS